MRVIGHSGQLERLKDAALSGRLANAYLLAGPDGIGKRSALQVFIMWLFCGNKDNAPCLECIPCRKVLHGTHPDVLSIAVEDDRKDITIEQIRKMQDAIQMHPLEGRYKVIIIDEAERMNDSSANSALKVLEEPPSSTHFFLVTSRPHMLLPTIISRCQKIGFSPPPPSETIPFIMEKRGTDRETASLLVSISGGSIGTALRLPVEAITDVTESLKRLWNKAGPTEVMAMAERWSRPGVDHSAVLLTMISIYRDIATCQAGGKTLFQGNMLKDIMKIAGSSTPESINKKLHAIISASFDIEATYNKQLLFEQLLFALY